MTAQRRMQLKRKEAGLCIRCATPVHVGVHCDSCRIEINDRRRAAYIMSSVQYLMDNNRIDRSMLLRIKARPHHVYDPQC